MFVAKLKGIALAVGTMSAVVSGAVVLAQGQSGSGTGTSKGQVVAQVPPPAVAKSDAEQRTAALERKLDRVLDALERMSSSDATRRPSRDSRPVLTSDDELPAVDVLPPRASRPPVPSADVRLAATSDIPGLDELQQANTPAPTAERSTRPGMPRSRMAIQRDTAPSASPQPRHVSPDSVPMLNPVDQGPRSNSVLPPSPVPSRDASLSDRIQNVENEMQQVMQRLEQIELRLKALDARVGGVDIEVLTPAGVQTLPPRGAN